MEIMGLKCPSCLAPLQIEENKEYCVCQYCGVHVALKNPFMEQQVDKEPDQIFEDENSLLERAFLFIEDGEFADADQYLERVLDINPHISKAYIGKLLCCLHFKKIEDLSKSDKVLTLYDSFIKATNFANPEELKIYQQLNEEIIERLNREKAYIEQKIDSLEKEIAKIKECMAKSENEFSRARAKKIRCKILGMILICVAAVFLIGVVATGSPIIIAIDIVSVILLVLFIRIDKKNSEVFKKYRSMKKALKTNEENLNRQRNKLQELMKKYG